MTARDEKRRGHYHQMAEGLRRLEAALHAAVPGRDAVPEAWLEIATNPGPLAKEKVTLWVEKDVLSFFRSLGQGHTARMGLVLSSFMHARLAGVINGPADVDYYEAEREDQEWQARALKAYSAELRAEEARDPPDPIRVEALKASLRVLKRRRR